MWDSWLSIALIGLILCTSTLAHLSWYLIIFGIHNLFDSFFIIYRRPKYLVLVLLVVYRISHILLWVLLGGEQGLGLGVFDRAITYIRMHPLFPILMFRFRLNSWIYGSILFVQALLGFRTDQWGKPVILGYKRQEECFRGQNGHSRRKEAICGFILRPDRRTKPQNSSRSLGCKTAATHQPQNQPPINSREAKRHSAVSFRGLAAVWNRRLSATSSISWFQP